MPLATHTIPEPAPTLAVVTHDAPLCTRLLDQLRAHGFSAWGATSEAAFYRELAVRDAGVVVCDGELPGDGDASLLRHLAPAGRHGLVALVPPGGEAAAKAAGAHASISKPVDVRRLLYGISMVWENMSQRRIPGNAWRLDPGGPRLVAPNGSSMLLTHTEHRLLGGLMACYGQTLTKEQLISLLWGRHSERDYHGVEVLLSRLRRKAQKELDQALPVKAVQAVGLIFFGQVSPNVP